MHQHKLDEKRDWIKGKFIVGIDGEFKTVCNQVNLCLVQIIKLADKYRFIFISFIKIKIRKILLYK